VGRIRDKSNEDVKSLAAQEMGIELSPPQELHKSDYLVFFGFAREHCCNYAGTGPWGKKHFCWLEPKENNSFCVLPWGRYCRWFVEAVLPLDRELELAWHRLRGTAKVDQKAQQERECGNCGKVFVRSSNRQGRCLACAQKQAKEVARNRKRAHRKK
jgi:hypothetical protein